ncbi:MAG: Mov34/MPN/PAD-1 family protein [Thaumarchaeota archaeon]|nr:Mov34/MPN/PAD-1 family protein [Nitrososphaerota archaeon]
MFKAKGTKQASFLWRQRPKHNSNYICFGPASDEFEAYIHKDVLECILLAAKDAMPNETIGLLGGRVCQDGKGNYTIVQNAECARKEEVEVSPGHVYISSRGNAQLKQRLELIHPTDDVIGWYHSHPTCAARFSPEDTTEQSTWPDPYNIGIVVSGLSKGDLFGVYCGPKAMLLPLQPSSEIFQPIKTDEVDNHSQYNLPTDNPMKSEKTISQISGNQVSWIIISSIVVIIVITSWFHYRLSLLETKLEDKVRNIVQQNNDSSETKLKSIQNIISSYVSNSETKLNNMLEKIVNPSNTNVAPQKQQKNVKHATSTKTKMKRRQDKLQINK